ncbi:MAG: hypothetical protein IT181_09625 [Acidobacteria bacterium]|nr:hypothetical protein [Acidobacteriota bacterium]
MRVRVLLGVVMLVMAARSAAAQEAGDVGVTMGYPGALGVVWHVTDGIALRPDIALTRSTSESTTSVTGVFVGSGLSSTSTSEGWGTSVGVSVLVNVRTIDRLRLYLAPRIAYARSTADNESGLSGALTGFTAKTTGVLASGSFGSQFSLHDRFAVFGELGLQYTTQTTTSDFPGSSTEAEGTTFGLRSAVGVTFYF